MLEPILLLAITAGLGVFLAFTGLVLPPSVRLEKPERGLMKKLQNRLDAAEMPTTAGEFLASCGIFAAVVGGIAILLGAPVMALAGAIIAPVILWQRMAGRRDKFLQEYNESLAEVVQLMREGFSATGSMRDALQHVVNNGPDPAAADFREVWSAQATGKTLLDAFTPVVERRRNPYLRMVAEALTLKSSEGGDVGKVLRGLETMIREQTHLRREINAKQSQARLESSIVSAAPVLFFLLMKIMPWLRGYEQGFYKTMLGQIILAGAIILGMASYVLSTRIASSGLALEIKEVAPQ